MRDSIEAALGRWGIFVASRPWSVIFCVLVLTALLGTQIRHFAIETSNEAFFHPDDPIRLQNDRFQEIFGRDTAIAIALRPDAGVFDLTFLERLREVHQAIEDEVPYIVDVTSLWNVRETLGSEDGLEVRDLLEDWPETPAELEAIERRARANPLYRNFVLSADGRSTMILVETLAFSPTEDVGELAGFDGADAGEAAATGTMTRTMITAAEDQEVLTAIEAILDRIRTDEIEIHIAGMPSFTTILTRTMMPDMARAIVLSVVVVAFFLGLLFRTFVGVALPLATVGLSVFTAMSVMGGVGIPMMPPTQIIPSFLLAVGIGGAVHLLAIFYQEIRRGLSRAEAIPAALAHSGLPIIMTSLTTAGGLLSFIPAALLPISHFGIIGPIGILLTLAYVLVFLPALLAVAPVRLPSKDPIEEGDTNSADTASQRALLAIGQFSTARPGIVIASWVLLMVVSAAGIARIQIGHDMINWFPEEEPIVGAIDFLNSEFGGAASFEILVSTGEKAMGFTSQMFCGGSMRQARIWNKHSQVS